MKKLGDRKPEESAYERPRFIMSCVNAWHLTQLNSDSALWKPQNICLCSVYWNIALLMCCFKIITGILTANAALHEYNFLAKFLKFPNKDIYFAISDSGNFLSQRVFTWSLEMCKFFSWIEGHWAAVMKLNQRSTYNLRSNIVMNMIDRLSYSISHQ